MNGKGYGMPSSHAQFLAFFSIYLSLFLLVRHRPPVPEHNRLPSFAGPLSLLIPSPYIQRVILALLVLGMAVLVSFSRIYLNYHTPRQVLVGCSAGVLSAISCYLVTLFIRKEGWLYWILDSEICRWLRIRDLVIEEDLAESGWREWDRRRRTRQIEKKKT